MPHTHAHSHRHAPIHNARRLLRGDPTRTLSISRRWVAEINRRVRKLNKEVTNFISTLDVFGLDERKRPPVFLVQNIEPRAYEFVTDADKLPIFRDWFKKQVDEGVLGIGSFPAFSDQQKPWQVRYVDSAYKKGITNAYLSSKEAKLASELGVGEQTAENFLRSSFLLPETVAKVRFLATRSYEQLKGFTDAMAQQTNFILAQGIADGHGARTIAKQMTEKISGLTKQRAHAIARTEVINAHANGQLDTFQQLGVEELGVKAEWVTAGDDRVCPDCFAQEAQIFTIEEARGLIPFHPNCVLGDSLVEFEDGLAMTRVKYFGRIIHLTTSSKRRLSVTENHVLLTADGWMRAKDISKGTKLIEAPDVQSKLGRVPDKDHVVTVADLFRAFSELAPPHFGVVARSAPEDFHGDGGAINEEVDVVVSDCKLRNEGERMELGDSKQFSFTRGNVPAFKTSELVGDGDSPSMFKRLALAADGIMSGNGVSPVHFGRPPFHHEAVGFGQGAEHHAGKFKTLSDNLSGDTESFCNFVDALPFAVTLDEVTDVEIVEAGGAGIFAFDVTTHSSLYALEGVVSSNCRCTWVPYVPDPGDSRKTQTAAAAKEDQAARQRTQTRRDAQPKKAPVAKPTEIIPQKQRVWRDVTEGIGPANVQQGVASREAIKQAYQEIGEQMKPSGMLPTSSPLRPALRDYQGSTYTDINQALWRGGFTEHQDYIRDYVRDLDAIMKTQTLKEDLLVFRGTKFEPEQMIKGAIIEERGYVSTTLHPSIVSSFEEAGVSVAIRAPKGVNAIHMDRTLGQFNHEYEIVLNRGSKFHVTGETIIKEIQQGVPGTPNYRIDKVKFHVVELIPENM